MLAVLGQKLWCRDEHGVGQAGVGVRAAPVDGQVAIAVGQGLGDARETLLGPRSLGQRPAGAEGDGLAVDVDLAGGFPVAAHRGVVQPGVMRSHLR